MFGWFLLGALLGCESRPERPNIVLVTLDTTRADHMGAWGYHRDTSKNLDQLASESIVFENLLVPMATTLPSHTSLLTGTEPLEHGVLANMKHGGYRFQSSPSLKTFTQLLKEEGYVTAAFLSATPLQEGSGIEAGFDVYECPEKGSRDAANNSRRVEKWLDEVGEPFFLWVHYFDPHGPFDPPKRHTKDYRRDGKVYDWLEERDIGETSERPTGQVLDSVDAVNLYDGEIRYMDRQVNRVFEALRQEGHWKDTVIIVVGDHGEGLGQHGMAGHGGVWREQLHAPFFVHTPWDEPQRITRPVAMSDVLPTVVALADLPGGEGLSAQASGVDVFSSPPRALYHSSSARQLSFGRVQDALSVGRFRYVRLEDGTDRMFDGAHDPHELADVSVALPIHAALMHKWTVDTAWALQQRGLELGHGDAVPMSPDDIEQLRLLGYVDDEEPAADGPTDEPVPDEVDKQRAGDP